MSTIRESITRFREALPKLHPDYCNPAYRDALFAGEVTQEQKDAYRTFMEEGEKLGFHGGAHQRDHGFDDTAHYEELAVAALGATELLAMADEEFTKLPRVYFPDAAAIMQAWQPVQQPPKQPLPLLTPYLSGRTESAEQRVDRLYRPSSWNTWRGAKNMHAASSDTLTGVYAGDTHLRAVELKRAILTRFTSELTGVGDNLEEAKVKVRELVSSGAHGVLDTGQGFATRLFPINTSSIDALHNIMREVAGNRGWALRELTDCLSAAINSQTQTP